MRKIAGYSGFAIGIDRIHNVFCRFLSKKTTPRGLYETQQFAKLLQ
jgi:hypothetical protein